MVIYTCTTCKKDFNRKSNYDYHIENKKNPCRPLTNINNLQQNPNNLQQKLTNLQKDDNDIVVKNEYEQNIEKCNYCSKTFFNIYSLKRHLDKTCKIKKEDDKNKKNIFELLLEKEKLEKENLKNEMNELKKKLDDLTNTIKELTVKTSVTTNTNTNCNNNIGNITNIIIPSDKLAKFGKEDLSKITQNDFLKITSKQGYGIFMECAKLIYNNDSVNQTVYVADVSRKKAMIWDNNQWVLSDLEDVLYIIKEKIRDLYNINLDTIEDKRIIEDFEKRVQKYFDMLYDEYDEDKKDDKRFIKRVQNMQNKFEHNLIKWLFNIKPEVLKNYNDIREKVLLLENEKKEKIDNKNIVEPVTNIFDKPKKRGRPLKI